MGKVKNVKKGGVRMGKLKFRLVNLALVCLFVFGGSPKGFSQNAREIKSLIRNLEVGQPLFYENLTIIPIYNTRINNHIKYVTLDRALKKGWLEIKELDGGRVPEVQLSNKSNNHIYIMGGEILTGCKQDRIVGRDVLIKPKSRNILVPVYCVEQGRWNYESDNFYSQSNLGTYKLRSQAQIAGSEAQTRIWEGVSDMSRSLGVSSGTNAYQEIYEDKEVSKRVKKIERYIQSVPQLHSDTVGVVVGLGSKIVSVDIFANPYLFKALWPKLAKSSALSAVNESSTGTITQTDAAQFLRTLHDKTYIQKSAIDLGFELSVSDHSANINALVYAGSVIHLAGFSQDNNNKSYYQNHDRGRRIPVMIR